MQLDFESRKDVLKGFIEGRIHIGDDAHTVGLDCSLLFEAMEQSTISTNEGDKVERDAHGGDYNKVRV